MLRALAQLRKIRRSQAHAAEAPIAQILACYINANRDTKKNPQPFPVSDFYLYPPEQEVTTAFTPETASAALSLQADGKCPPLVISVWPEIIKSLNTSIPAPAIRALHNDDKTIWILAPVWEGLNVRGGLVAVQGNACGVITVRDLDKPLNQYKLRLPSRKGFGWVEAACLLVKES